MNKVSLLHSGFPLYGVKKIQGLFQDLSRTCQHFSRTSDDQFSRTYRTFQGPQMSNFQVPIAFFKDLTLLIFKDISYFKELKSYHFPPESPNLQTHQVPNSSNLQCHTNPKTQSTLKLVSSK